jgi:signal transduction histidine kinase
MRMRAFVRKGEFDPQPGDLVACVREAVALIEPDAHSAGVRIAVEAPGSVPGVRPFDAIQIQQLIVNLIRNATDSIATRGQQRSEAGPRGLVRVSIEPSVGSVRVVVSDDGPGVPEGDRSRLFEPFFTTKPHGTGLGLMICQKIAELHDGRLTYRPVGIGSGAEFTLALPRQVSVGAGCSAMASSQIEVRPGVTGAGSEVAA